jgi:DNA-binding HxlR family transcriptional regulator
LYASAAKSQRLHFARRSRDTAARAPDDGRVTALATEPSARAVERTRSARLIHDTLDLLTSKWSVDVLLALGDGSRRYHELLHDLTPISEKVLTQTLRAMERDGLIGRRVHAEVPPRVDYALTPLGATLAAPMRALGSWSVTHGRHVDAARERFDLRRAIQRQEQRKAA